MTKYVYGWGRKRHIVNPEHDDTMPDFWGRARCGFLGYRLGINGKPGVEPQLGEEERLTNLPICKRCERIGDDPVAR